MKNIAVFASGNGSNFEAIANACEKREIEAKVKILICNKKDAFVLQRAQKYNIDTFVFDLKNFDSKQSCETKIVEVLKTNNIDLICLAGYMLIVGQTLLNAFEGKILNIHPSLLPSFKGANAVADAFAFGVKVFGVTVHLIDNTIDGGTIIAQRAFEYCGNSIDEVEAKIHQIEHRLYVEAINLLLR